MRILSVLVAALFFLPGKASAKTVNIEYILDASGSMLEDMAGQQTQHGHSLIELIPEFPVEAGQLVEIEL